MQQQTLEFTLKLTLAPGRVIKPEDAEFWLSQCLDAKEETAEIHLVGDYRDDTGYVSYLVAKRYGDDQWRYEPITALSPVEALEASFRHDPGGDCDDAGNYEETLDEAAAIMRVGVNEGMGHFSSPVYYKRKEG